MNSSYLHRIDRLAAILLIGTTLHAAPPAEKLEKRAAWTTSRIQGTPERPLPYRVEPVLPRLLFDKPMSVVESASLERLFIAEKDGKILSVPKDPTRDKADLVVDLKPHGLQLLLDITLHPEFSENRFLFVCYVHRSSRPGTLVSRFKVVGDSPPRIDPASEEVIIQWPSGGHNGACLRFGPKDGYLYVSAGDGVGPNPPDSKNAGQDVSNLLSTVFRIDVDKTEADRKYSVPDDNPFYSTAGARPEIWAYGFRNPWRMGFDSETGALWLADVGWETWESVHRVVRGGNYGWSVTEGAMPLRGDVPRGPTPILPPVKMHGRADANSITGGIVHRGKNHPNLTGAFIYGDYVTGKIWGIRSDDDGVWSEELADTDLRIIAFGSGSDGEIYVLDHDFRQQLYKLVPAPLDVQREPFPKKLSETGLFSSVADLQPAAGVVEYRIRAEPWMDGATAERHVAIPGDARIRVVDGDPAKPWEYPVGTVFARTLSLERPDDAPRLRVETQILHYDGRSWRPYAYAWNDEQRDAELVPQGGTNRKVDLPGSRGTTDRVWRHSGRAECVLCHNVPVGSVLGFEVAQLDIERKYEDTTKRQLQALVELGVLDRTPPVESGLARLVPPHDETQDLDERARSYLHVNCGVCHNRGGDGTVTIFFLRALSLPQTAAFRQPGVGTFGITSPNIIKAGDPEGCILLYRMAKLGYARMPHVGSQMVDSEGWTLLHDWIKALGLAEEAQSRLPEKDAASLSMLKDADATAEARDAAIAHLLTTTRGAMALLEPMHRGSLSPATHARAVELSQRSERPDIRGLFETFVPESHRQKRLGTDIDPQEILATPGDRARGERLFFSDAVRCQTCHPVAGKGSSQGNPLGPDLKGIGKKYERADLLRHVLDPSAEVAPEQAQYIVITNDGTVHSGLLVEKTPERVVIKTAEKARVEIAQNNVRLFEKQAKSLMPDLLLRDVTRQQAADLLAFLAALK